MSGAIDVSLLPAPDAIKAVSAASIKAERIADLKLRFAAAGIPWDVEKDEGDAAMVLQEEDTFRELLDKQAINDAVKAVLPAYSWGTNLDALVARANVQRLVVVPADPVAGTAAVMESDAKLLDRYLNSFSAPGAGSDDAYLYAAKTAWPARRDVAVLGPEVHGQRGRIEIVLLAEGGGDVPDSAVAAVYAAVTPRSVRPTTDVVVVTRAIVLPWTCAATLYIRRGPDPALVLDQAGTAIQAVADQYFAIGNVFPANIVPGVLRVPNVQRVGPTSPVADVAPPRPADLPRAAPYLAAVALTPVVLP